VLGAALVDNQLTYEGGIKCKNNAKIFHLHSVSLVSPPLTLSTILRSCHCHIPPVSRSWSTNWISFSHGRRASRKRFWKSSGLPIAQTRSSRPTRQPSQDGRHPTRTDLLRVLQGFLVSFSHSIIILWKLQLLLAPRWPS
jgi:hypothetical protein